MIDYRMLLGGRNTTMDTFNSMVNNMGKFQTMRNNEKVMPLQNKFFELRNQATEQELDIKNQANNLQEAFRFNTEAMGYIQAGRTELAAGMYNDIINKRRMEGASQEEIMNLEMQREQLLMDPGKLAQELAIKNNAIQQQVGGRNGTPAGLREHQFHIDVISNPDQYTSDQVMASKVALGLTPRAGISAQERIAQSPQTTQQVAGSQAVIEGSKERAKGDEQIVTEEKREGLNRKIAQRDNDKIFRTYQNAIGSVEATLGGTETGYFVGLLPAVTASQRTADGAKSVILPILKSMFRSAGEGVFTDKDQELLEGMIPTRQDPPEAIKMKLIMLDNVVRAKLNQPLYEEGVQPQIISIKPKG